MAITPFVRHPTLSSANVLKRMEAKRVVFAIRREAIKREIEFLSHPVAGRGADDPGVDTSVSTRPADFPGASGVVSRDVRIADLRREDLAIDSYSNDLEALIEVEEAALNRRRERSAVIDRPSNVPRASVEADGDRSMSRSTVSAISAGAGASIERYEEGLCLFLREGHAVGMDRDPKPIEPIGRSDALLERLASLVDVPGLAHMAVLSERSQEAILITSAGVPPFALGLPAAAGFAEHLFSADAYLEIQSEASAASFLVKIRKGGSKRPR